MKLLLCFTILLILVSCGGEQKFTENEFLSTQVKMLQTFCENRQPCINDIEYFAVDCQKQHANRSDFDALSFEEKAMAGGMFQACIIMQMDEHFQARYNQAFPVVETNIKTSSSSGGFNVSYAFENDPGYLQIHEVKGRFMVQGKSLQANEIKAFIKDNQLTDSFHSAALIVSDDLDMGLFMDAKRQIEKSGFQKVSIARKERLEALGQQ